MTTEYSSPTGLVEAFVNDNITKGNTFYKDNDIVITGNALYAYKKPLTGGTEYIQIAIRIPDNVFILNKFTTGKDTIANLVESTIIRSIKGKYIHMKLRRTNQLTENGDVRPDVLREAINNLKQPSAYLIRKSLKTFGKDRMQEAAIENIRQLQTSIRLINNGNLRSGTAIIVLVKELEHAKKVYHMLDKYLDILTQFPELKL